MKTKDDITKTYLYNFDLLKPHFYIVKLGFTGVYIIFLISAQKHRLWVLVKLGGLVTTHCGTSFLYFVPSGVWFIHILLHNTSTTKQQI